MKKFLLITIFFFSFLVLFTTPSFAAGNSSANVFQSFFQKIQTSISNTAQKLYLMLPGDKPGNVVINQAAQASAQLQSEQISADVSVDFQSNNQSLANVKVHADGPVKMNQTGTQNYQQDLHLVGDFSMQGTTMEADANVKATNQKIYFQLNEVPVLPVINLTSLKGRWLSLDTSSTADTTTPTTWTDAQKQAFQQATTDLLMKSQFSSAQKQTKDDHQVYVVMVTVPKTALTDYITAIQKISVQNQTNPADANMMMSSQEEITKMLDNVGPIQATIWVDQSSFYIRHVELPLVYTKPADAVMTPTNTTNPLAGVSQFQTLNISVVMNFDQFNQPVTFEEPTNAEDAKQVLQGVLGMGATGATGLNEGGMPQLPTGTTPSFNPTELPNLTPQQKLELEQFNKLNKTTPAVPAY